MIFFQNATFRAKKQFVCPPFHPQYAPLSQKSSKALPHSPPPTQNSTQNRPILPNLQTNVKATSYGILKMGWVDWRKSGSEDIYWGIDYAMLPNREWNQKQKHKKQPWSKVEYFAFGRGTVCFASLETSSHAANHTIPPPPSYEGLPLCPKDKNRSPFHGEKPLIVRMIS